VKEILTGAPVQTLSFWVHLQLGGRHGRFTDAIVRDTLESAVVLARLCPLDPQHRTLWHRQRDEALVAVLCDTLPTTPPVHVRRRITGRLAEETDYMVLQDALVGRC